MTSIDIGGHEVSLKIPDDAMVTGAIVIATYQRIDGENVGAGTVWAYSAIPHVQAVGMMRLATNAIEDVGDYS